MHVVFYRQTSNLFRRGKHRAQVNVEAEIGIGAGDHLGAAIVAILAHFGDQNARAAAVIHQEPFGLRNDGVKFAGGCV